jgi:hypothetical protein
LQIWIINSQEFIWGICKNERCLQTTDRDIEIDLGENIPLRNSSGRKRKEVKGVKGYD